MYEIYTVYDLIEVLRLKHDYSSRRLAIEANVSTATLASLMTRKPSTIAIDTLDKIARVFGARWYDLLNKPNSIVDEYILEKRVPVTMTADDIAEAGYKITEDHYFMEHIERIHRLERRGAKAVAIEKNTVQTSEIDRFKNSLSFVLDKLNDDGLMEAMRRILDVANDPKYCKNKESS